VPLGFDTQLLKRHNYLAAFKTSHFLAHTALYLIYEPSPYSALGPLYHAFLEKGKIDE
jgi:hypothetical protein